MRIVAAYVLSRTPRFIADLPIGCKPRAMDDAQEVSSYAWALVMAQCDSGCNGSAALADMEQFFSIASLRLSLIQAPRSFTVRPREESHGD